MVPHEDVVPLGGRLQQGAQTARRSRQGLRQGLVEAHVVLEDQGHGLRGVGLDQRRVRLPVAEGTGEGLRGVHEVVVTHPAAMAQPPPYVGGRAGPDHVGVEVPPVDGRDAPEVPDDAAAAEALLDRAPSDGGGAGMGC